MQRRVESPVQRDSFGWQRNASSGGRTEFELRGTGLLNANKQDRLSLVATYPSQLRVCHAWKLFKPPLQRCLASSVLRPRVSFLQTKRLACVTRWHCPETVELYEADGRESACRLGSDSQNWSQRGPRKAGRKGFHG